MGVEQLSIFLESKSGGLADGLGVSVEVKLVGPRAIERGGGKVQRVVDRRGEGG